VTYWVNWSAAPALAAGLAAGLGLTWLLRGGRAALRMCLWTGLGVIGVGLAAGNVIGLAAGAITAACAGWSLRPMPGSARRSTGRRRR
jgi:hypothetical protein